jgi:hypothetical protein
MVRITSPPRRIRARRAIRASEAHSTLLTVDYWVFAVFSSPRSSTSSIGGTTSSAVRNEPL